MKQLLLTLLTLLMSTISTSLLAQAELQIILEEQTPEAIQERCSIKPNEPTLTPSGVINPFQECLKGNSEMRAYVPQTTKSDSDKLNETNNNTAPVKPTVKEEAGEFNPNASDPEDFPDITEDDMKAFLKMVQDAQE